MCDRMLSKQKLHYQMCINLKQEKLAKSVREFLSKYVAFSLQGLRIDGLRVEVRTAPPSPLGAMQQSWRLANLQVASTNDKRSENILMTALSHSLNQISISQTSFFSSCISFHILAAPASGASLQIIFS